MRQHVTIVAALHIGLSLLLLLAAVLVFTILFGIGWASGDRIAANILTVIGSMVGGFMVIVGLPGLVGGIGLLQWRPWSRILMLIVSAMNLINVPVGTAVGVYSIWVLTREETAQLFEAAETASA